MAADFNKPVTTDLYTDVLSIIRDNFAAQAQMFDGAMGFSNTPTDAIRLNKASGVFQKWTGSWVTVTLTTAALADAAITTPKIADANVTAGKLASGAAASNLGFTPANKAGDTFTGDVGITSNAPKITFTESDASSKVWLIYANGGAWGIFEDNTSTPRLSIAQGAGVLALATGATGLTFGGATVWTSANDGTGSGLDADTVDGQNFSTSSTPQLAGLGLGAAHDASTLLYMSATNLGSNAARRGVYSVLDNDTTTLTADRAHHAALHTIRNDHFDASGFALSVHAIEGRATSGGVGVSAKAGALYGGRFTAENLTDQASNNTVTAAYAVGALLKSGHTNAVITTGYGVYSEVNAAAAGSIVTAYLFYGAYTGTAPTAKRGMRLVGEDKSQFDGSLGLGIDPTQKLHVSGNGLFTGTITAGTQLFGGGSQAASAPDFSFTGDTDSGLRRTGADAIALVTGGTDRVQIDSTGLVGINQAPATYRLGISGTLNATSLYENGTLLTAIYGRLGNPNTWTDVQTVSRNTTSTVMALVSTDGTAADWPGLSLDRQKSGGGAANDLLASVLFKGYSSTSVTRNYARVRAKINSPANTAETGLLELLTIQAGAEAVRAYLGAGLVVGSPTGGDKGVNTINATTIYWNGTSLAGKANFSLPYSAFHATATAGATEYSAETGTNKVMIKGWSFGPSTQVNIQARFPMPKGYNKGAFNLILRGVRHTGSSANQIRFGARAAMLDSGDASDIAFGTAVEANVTPSATALVQFEITLSSITPSGSVSAANASMIIEIYRDTGDAADAENTQDIVIQEAIMDFTTTAPTDD